MSEYISVNNGTMYRKLNSDSLEEELDCDLAVEIMNDLQAKLKASQDEVSRIRKVGNDLLSLVENNWLDRMHDEDDNECYEGFYCLLNNQQPSQ